MYALQSAPRDSGRAALTDRALAPVIGEQVGGSGREAVAHEAPAAAVEEVPSSRHQLRFP